MSDTARWQRVRAVFQDALDHRPDAREAFLREACAGDEAMRREVLSLLAAHTAAGGFLDTPAFRLEDAAPPAAPEPTLQPGARLGRFEVTGALGAGGMGEVYRAIDTTLGREVAIKILPPALASDPQRLARFERESRVLASFKHPNIATIHSIEQAQGLRLLVLELVEGPTLAERVKEGPVPLGEAIAIARQLASALEAAHARGIVHRDLKPANVKLSPSGQVTLLDFGLAKARGDGEGAPSALANAGLETTAGLILGTLGYMSPEQARGRPVDERADVWAFGCVLFELLAGRPVFQGETPSDTIAAVLQGEPRWHDLPPALPPVLDRLLRRCLEKDPARRVADIGEARLALDEAAQQAAGSATNVTTARRAPSSDRAARAPVAASSVVGALWSTTTRRAVTTLLAVLVASVGAGGWYLFRPAPAIDTLAILPFDTRGSDPDADYLGDEIADGLIGQMSRVTALTVMARGTTARYKGAVDPRGAGQALGVGAVLSGTVAKQGDRLAVRVELIDVRTGARLWGDAYDRPAGDLMQVQGEIAAATAGGLRLRLSAPDRQVLRGQGTHSAEAYELALRARHLLYTATEAGDVEARQLFERAAALDPRFVEAHLGVAATSLRAAAEGEAPPGEAQRRAASALDRVLALEPDNVRARASRASLAYQRDWNWAAADREFRVLVNDPRLYIGVQHHAAAIYFWAIGRPEESAAIVERALRTDPGNLESRAMLCDFREEAGRLDEAVACYRALSADVPDDPRPLFGMAEVLRRRDDLAGAIDALRRAYQRTGEDVGVQRLAGARTAADYREAELAVARARLDELRALATERYVSPLDLARLYAQAGDRQAAFAALDRALAERSPLLVLLKVANAWDPIRDDPRFAAVVHQVGIP
jgi:TolB-like protein/tetratricopeptide (TPR) repeat protein